MEKRYKYIVPYLSRDLIYQNIHPLRDAEFGADCLRRLRSDLLNPNWKPKIRFFVVKKP